MKYEAALPLVRLILIMAIVPYGFGQESIKVTGSVSDPQSVAIPLARITLYSFDRILQTTSDSAGHFQFKAIPADKYEFEVVAPGFKRTIRQVNVGALGKTPDKPMELTVGMELGATSGPTTIIAVTEVAPTGSCAPADAVTYRPRRTSEADALSGIIFNRYPSVPIAGATLKLFDATGAEIAQQTTNERGEFLFKQTAPGRYYIALQHPGYNSARTAEFWVARENATYITMQAVQLGRVVVCQ